MQPAPPVREAHVMSQHHTSPATPALAPAVPLVPALGVVLCSSCHDRNAPDRLASWSTPDRTRHYCGFCKLDGVTP
jgi:hypothetical protein